jgi:hypothetical protein
MREIHHPARHPRQPAARGGIRYGLGHGHSTITLRKTDIKHLIPTIAEGPAPAQIHRGQMSPHACPLAALAFDDPVTLLQQALTLAILAFLLLLDVRPFFIGHNVLPPSVASITMIQLRIAVHNPAQPI